MAGSVALPEPHPKGVAPVQARLIRTAVKIHEARRCLIRIHEDAVFVYRHPGISGPCEGIHGDFP